MEIGGGERRAMGRGGRDGGERQREKDKREKRYVVGTFLDYTDNE